MTGTFTVVVQMWEESERSWGVRPDGYSLHLSEFDRLEYIKRYWDSLPAVPPEEYWRPCGTPYLAQVDEAIYNTVVKSNQGSRYFNNRYPPG